MGAAGPILYMGGAILSAVNQVQAGKDKDSAFAENATIAEENAQEALHLSAQKERQIRIIGRKSIGDIKAGFSANGISGGSAFDVLADSQAMIESDVHTVREAGQNQANNFRRGATQDRLAGQVSRSSARTGAIAGLLNAAPTFSNMLPTGGK